MLHYLHNSSDLLTYSIDDNIQPVMEWGINWIAERKMILSLEEIQATLIKFSPNTSVPTVFSPLYIVTEWKYLGVLVDQYLKF